MSAYKETGYSIQYLGVVDNSLGILTKRVRNKLQANLKPIVRSLSKHPKVDKSESNTRNTFGKLHGVVKSGRKEVSSKIIKISEPLLAKNVRFESRENQRKTIERTLNESTISHFGTDINTIETNLDQISGEEIIKSVVCRNIAKEQKNDLEERKNKIIMKNQNKSDLLKEEQSKTPEIIFKEKIPILPEKKEAAVQELHKTPDQDPNPEKYNEYMVNHYSLPKKLRSSIRKISPPKEFKKIELKSTEHLNSKLSRSWMLKQSKRALGINQNFKTSLQNTIEAMKKKSQRDRVLKKYRKHQRSNSDLEAYPIEQNISFSEMKFPHGVNSARKFQDLYKSANGISRKLSRRPKDVVFENANMENIKFRTAVKKNASLEKKPSLHDYTKIKHLNKTSLRKIKEILDGQRRSKNTLLEQLIKDRNFALNHKKHHNRRENSADYITSSRMPESKSFSYLHDVQDTTGTQHRLEMEEMYLEGESEIQIQSEGIDEAVTYMKQTLHDMKLQDAIHRQDIRKLEKGNSKMEEKIEKLKKNIDQLEKQKTTDTQYLLKQNEFLTKVLMAKKIDASNEETGKPNTKTTDTHKERLKNKKESVKRTKELVDITNELEYKSSSILGEAQQLNQDIEQVEKYPEEHRSAIVKSLFMNMMNLMENLDSASKVSDYKGDTSALSQNTSTLNKSEPKLTKQDVLDCKISNDNDIIKKQIEDIDFRTSVIK